MAFLSDRTSLPGEAGACSGGADSRCRQRCRHLPFREQAKTALEAPNQANLKWREARGTIPPGTP